jgi:large subunit ribosomal protein L4
MSKVAVRNMQGEALGEHVVPDELLVLDRGAQAVHESVAAYRANQRAGTASTRGKGEVAGSGAKPWRQKGTGRARAGYRQSPIWRGGGTVFGPRPRSFRKTLTKKAARLAFCRAFSEQLAGGAVTVVDRFAVDAPRTRLVADALRKLGADGTVLLVVAAIDRNLGLAARNLPGVELVEAKDLNTYQVLRHRRILVTGEAMEVLEGRLRGRGGMSS